MMCLCNTSINTFKVRKSTKPKNFHALRGNIAKQCAGIMTEGKRLVINCFAVMADNCYPRHIGICKPRLVDNYVLEWQFENFELLMNNFSTGPKLPDSELWVPCDEHFGSTTKNAAPLEGPDLAAFIFERVKSQCGFKSANIKLVPTDEMKPQALAGVAIVQTNENAASGRYITTKKGDQYEETITYDRNLEQQPAKLIATFAHELSHALHCRSKQRLPIEPELYEMFTDLTAIYLGYGIFIANSRF